MLLPSAFLYDAASYLLWFKLFVFLFDKTKKKVILIIFEKPW